MFVKLTSQNPFLLGLSSSLRQKHLQDFFAPTFKLNSPSAGVIGLRKKTLESKTETLKSESSRPKKYVPEPDEKPNPHNEDYLKVKEERKRKFQELREKLHQEDLKKDPIMGDPLDASHLLN